MLRRNITALLLSTGLVAFAGCASDTGLHSPFKKETPFVATPVPADFAVIIDENHDTFYARQHIEQVVTSADAMSTTTYTTFRDYNNTVSNKFSQETPLSPVQLQNMWNNVARYNLLTGSRIWINWLSDSDLYRRNSYTVQLRANGQTRSYRFTNGSPGGLKPLLLQTDAVRLPITQNSKTPVVTTAPAAAPEEPAPSMPSTEPASTEATTTAPAPLLPATSQATTEPAPVADTSAIVPTTIPSMQPTTAPSH